MPDMEAEVSQPTRKRRRPPKACEQCRKRKVRCDQNSPCDQCVRLKISDCTYDPLALSNRNSKKKTTTPSTTSGAPPTPVSTVEATGEFSSTTRSIEGSISNPQSPFITNKGILVGSKRTKEHAPTELLEDRLFHIDSRDAVHASNPLGPTVNGNLQGTVTKTRLLGKSHWMYAAQELDFIFKIQSRIENGINPEIMLLFDKCKNLGRSIKSQTLAKLKAREKIRDHLPRKEVADDLVDKYFRVSESYCRILHIPTFQNEYNRLWSVPESGSTAFVVKLLLVLAIGTCLCDEQDYHEKHMMALQWINAAQSWLNCPFTEKAKISVTGIQIYCLYLVARETNAVGPDLVWVSAGSLMRMAMLTGLHRDPSHFKRISPFQVEMRRRLWATVMELCLQSSMNAGGLPMLSPDTYDCLSPANYDDTDLAEDMNCLPAPQDENVVTDSSLQIALIKTVALRLQIATLLNDFRSEESYSQVLQLDASLGETLRDISSRLRTARYRDGRELNDTGLRTYEVITYRFLLNLHQSYGFKGMKDPMYYYSRKACIDTALQILQVTLPASECTPSFPASPKSDFRKILETTRGAHRQIMLLAYMVAGLELVTQLQNPKTVTVSVADCAIRTETRRLVDAYVNLSWDQVRLEETNIKGCVCCRVIGQMLHALEDGTPNKDDVLATAESSLHEAVDVLQSRLDRLNGFTPVVPASPNDQFGNDFGLGFGDDFAWGDDWNTGFDVDSMNLFFAQP